MTYRMTHLILVFALLLSPVLFQSSLADPTRACTPETEWRWLHPVPQGNDLYGIWGNPVSNVFAVGERGTILRLTGSSWEVMESNTTERLNDVWVAPNGEGFAVGNNGIILRWNGAQWVHAASSVDQHLQGVWGTSDDNVYAVGYNGHILHFNGSNWSSMNSGTTIQLNDIWGHSENLIFAVGEGGTVLRYNGSSWSTQVSGTTKGLKGVSGSGANNVVAVGDDGMIIRFDGAGWSEMEDPDTDSNWNAVWVHHATDLVVVGANQAYTHFNGEYWMQYPNPPEPGYYPDFNALWAPTSESVLAVSGSGKITKITDEGWEYPAGGFTNYLSDIWAFEGDNAFAISNVEWDSGLFQYDGISWQPMLEFGFPPQNALWGFGPDQLYSVGEYGSFFLYDGEDVMELSWGEDQPYNGIWGTSPSDIFIVGDGSTLLHYDGDSLTDMTSEAPVAGLSLQGVWGSSGSNVFVVGPSMIFHFNGVDWTTHFQDLAGNPDFQDIWGSGPSDIFAVGPEDYVYHYNGSGWTPQPSGLSPGYNLASVWGTSPTDVYAVSSAGEVIHFDGISWTQVEQLTDNPLTGVHCLDPCNVFVVGERGTILTFSEPDLTATPPDIRPRSHVLHTNTPNPFNPTTTIRFELSTPANVQLEIFDVSGHRVVILVQGHRGAGEHVVSWDGRTDQGAMAGSGVYFYRLVTPKETLARKMVLLK